MKKKKKKNKKKKKKNAAAASMVVDTGEQMSIDAQAFVPSAFQST